MNKAIYYSLIGILAMILAVGTFVNAQRRGGGGGGGNYSRGSAQTSVNRPSNSNYNRNANVNRNTNVNRNSNVNVNRNVNVNVRNDVNYHGGYYGGGCCYHPVATAAAVTAATMVTAAVIGSVVNTIPPSCTTVMVNGVTYQQCGSTWYQPQFVGSNSSYSCATMI
jgi:hypothetical protein